MWRQASTRRRHGLEKESLTDFIKSKRQMFLLQYSLNVKRNEMQKLDEEAIQRELTVHNQVRLPVVWCCLLLVILPRCL